MSSNRYRDAGQRVGAGARGESCGSKRAVGGATCLPGVADEGRGAGHRGRDGGRAHHDVEFGAHGGATGVSGGHLYRNRLHIQSHRRALEGPRGGVEAQPHRQVRVVGFRRRVAQRVAGVRIVERVRRDFVAEIRAHRRCLVRDRVRDHRGVVGGERPACPPDLVAVAASGATPGFGAGVLEKRGAAESSRCRAAVQG